MSHDEKRRPMTRWKSVETKHMEERDALFRGLRNLDRRSFLKVSLAAAGAIASKGLTTPHSFQPVSVAYGQTPDGKKTGFRIAYISDSHLYERKLNERFVNALMRAVDDVNALDPQPDFVPRAASGAARSAQGLTSAPKS